MHKQKNYPDLLAPMPLSFYRLGHGFTPPPVYNQHQLLHLPRELINADQLFQLGGGIKPMATIRLAERPSTSLLMYELLFRTCN